MKRIFDEPQLKEGTYRAFIYEEGRVVVVPLTKNEEDMYLETAESFATKVVSELFDYELTFDPLGGSRTIEKLQTEGYEEVIV